jgi:long-chain fatty acid transport protein
MRIHTLAAVLAALGMTGAQAAGFALIEQNASGLGNAYAGQAASAQDASTTFFNPAGMTQVEGRQVVGALHYIHPSAKFSGSATSTIPGYTAPTALGGDAGEPAFVPNAYYTMDLGSGMKFGLGLNAPFGLATEYDRTWAGQVHAIKSEVQTININPALAWRVNDKVSVGVGINWQKIDAELTQFSPTAATVAVMEGDDDSWGWNAGLLVSLDDTTRVGLSYRSQIKHELEGTLNILGPIRASITLPDIASLSLFRRLNHDWDLLADLTWTGWSDFHELRVLNASTGATTSLVTENWDDVLRISLGANWRMSDQWTLRFGVAYDQTPVPDAAHRTPRIPDQDRTWLAFGGQYNMSKHNKLDIGYAHLFVKDASISHCEPESLCGVGVGVTLNGSYDNAVDILSVQYTHSF